MKHRSRHRQDQEDDRRPNERPLKLEMIYQEDDFFVVNKPPGMWPRHGLFDEEGVTDKLAALASVDESQLANVFPLEPDVSGLLVVTSNAETHQGLCEQYESGKMTLTFLAIVRAMVMNESGVIDRPLRESGAGGDRVRVDPEKGKPAITEWRVRDSFVGFALLECVPRTRIPHQVRAHLADAGLTLAVDRLFGGAEHLMLSSFKSAYRRSKRRPERPLIQRPSLHACAIEFENPRTGEKVSFEANPPKDFRATLHQLDRFGRVPKSGRPHDH